MTVKVIKEFLIMVMNKELEEEYVTTDDKEYIKMCILAKQWLLGKGKGIDEFLNAYIIKEDIEKYYNYKSEG